MHWGSWKNVRVRETSAMKESPVHGEHFRCGKWGWGIDVMTSQDERAELKESSRSWEFTDNIPIILKQQQQLKSITK